MSSRVDRGNRIDLASSRDVFFPSRKRLGGSASCQASCTGTLSSAHLSPPIAPLELNDVDHGIWVLLEGFWSVSAVR